MPEIRFPEHRCRISDNWSHNGMQVVWMENDLLRIGILPGRGGDIFEMLYKPAAVNILLRLDKPIRNPAREFPQIRNTGNQLEDYYYGGWQMALPNSAPMRYRGAELGQHGEVWMIPWEYAITKETPEEIQLKLWTRPIRVPLLVERTLTMNQGAAVLHVSDSISNESNSDLDVMWGQHIALGSPLLHYGGILDTNATQISADPSMPPNRRIAPGESFRWPNARTPAGEQIDVRTIHPENGPSYSELAYLSGFVDEAYYTVYPRTADFGFKVSWDKDIFPYLWLWEERRATVDAPWWGSVFAYALEPWTSKHPADPETAIANGEWLLIPAGQSIRTELKAQITDKEQDNEG